MYGPACYDEDADSLSNVSLLQASNPGQFDNDVDVLWNKGQTQDSVIHMVRHFRCLVSK